MVLKDIISYLYMIPKGGSVDSQARLSSLASPRISLNFKITQIHLTLNSRTSVSVISIVDIDVLYDF